MSSSNNVWHRLITGSEKQFVMGASVYRLIAGFAILLQYLINYGQRRYLYGPDGVWPWEIFASGMEFSSTFSIYAWSSSLVYFEICFHLGLLVALLWFLGWRTRWLTPLNFVFWWSLHERFSSLWDGGDNLMQLTFLFAMVADVGSHFSLDALRGGPEKPRHPALARVEATFHNLAILAFAIQICLVYGVAGLTKVQGEVWRNGTALYHSMRNGEYLWPGFAEMVYQNVYLVTGLSYATVLFQVSFPFLLFMNRHTRLVAVGMGMMFHIGIALFLGLITFSMFMMAVDLSLITDDEYRAARRWLVRMAHRAGLVRMAQRVRLAGQPAPEPAPEAATQAAIDSQ